MAVKFGQNLPTTGVNATPENIKLISQRAEDLGYDSVWCSDHLVIPHSIASRYPYTADGETPFSPRGTYLDSITALTFVVACTTKLRVATNVLIIPYRHPIVTAKQLATLDVLSEGRLTLGVGVGWMREEFEYLGLDTYERRGKVTDEYIQLYQETMDQGRPRIPRGVLPGPPAPASIPSRSRSPIPPSTSAATPGPPCAAPPSTATDGSPTARAPHPPAGAGPSWSPNKWKLP